MTRSHDPPCDVGDHESEETDDAARRDRRSNGDCRRHEHRAAHASHVDADALRSLISPENRVQATRIPHADPETDRERDTGQRNRTSVSPRQAPHQPEKEPLGPPGQRQHQHRGDRRADRSDREAEQEKGLGATRAHPVCKESYKRNDSHPPQKCCSRDAPLRRSGRAGQNRDDGDHQCRPARHTDDVRTGHRILEKGLQQDSRDGKTCPDERAEERPRQSQLDDKGAHGFRSDRLRIHESPEETDWIDPRRTHGKGKKEGQDEAGPNAEEPAP